MWITGPVEMLIKQPEGMARPKKDNAEYFPHEANMRNDDRVKALRKKFKLQGYAIWNMLIEYLTSKDHFQFEYNDFTLEIIAGDFDAEKEDIQQVISYCLTLGLLQQKDGFIRCFRLEKGLEPLLSKRKRDQKGVIDTGNPQSKGEKSKVKKSIITPAGKKDIPDFFKSDAEAFEGLKSDQTVIEKAQKICSAKGWRGLDEVGVVGLIKTFVHSKADLSQPQKEVKQHFKNWLFSEKTERLNEIVVNFKQQLNAA